MADPDVPKGVVDPTSVSFMAGAGAILTSVDLSDQEITIFDRDLKRLATGLTLKERTAPEIWLEDRDTYLWAVSIAKKQFGDIPFTGLLSLGSGTFGIQPIRSIYILSGSPQTWLVTYSSTGWVSKQWNVNLATSTGTVTNTYNRVILCIPRLANYGVSPKVNMVRWTVGPTTYAVQVVDWFKAADLWVAKNIGAALISKNGTFTTDVEVEATGVDGTAAFGLAIATGDWLQLET